MFSLRLVVLALACVSSASTHAIPNADVRSGPVIGTELRKQLGFDLSSSHGSVAIAYNNGSKIAIARIEGNEDYKRTMKEMAQGRRFPFLGHPNEETAFTVILNELRIRAEHYLGYTIDAALVTMPNLAGHRSTALAYALRNVGLRNLDGSVRDSIGFAHPPALYASAGLGLCKNYGDVKACFDELGEMPVQTVLTVLFTNNSLCVESSDLQSAYGYTGRDTIPSSMDFSLGYQERHNNPDEKYFWSAVQDRIMRAALVTDLRKPIMVFVNGDAVATADHNLRITINEAMTKILGKTIPIYDADPEIAAVLGAAEIARRGSWPYLEDPNREKLVSSSSPGLLVQGP